MRRHRNTLEQYLSNKFYNILFNKTKSYLLAHKGSLYSNRIENINYVKLEDIEVSNVQTTIIEQNKVSFTITIVAQVIVKGWVKREYEDDIISTWYTVQANATLDDGIHDLEFTSIDDYSKRRFDSSKDLSKGLIPYIYAEELDDIANEFLIRYYPEVLEKPKKLNPRVLAKRMGLKIATVSLSKSKTVFGQICFRDSIVNIYDKETDSYHKSKAKRGMILIDPDVHFMRTIGSVNNTIVHECVHWDKHKLFFELQSLFYHDASSIRCQVSETQEKNRNKWSDYQWMEWQANALTPRILMPKQQTIQKIEELIEKNQLIFQSLSSYEVYESVIQELAEFFDVSVQAAKIRMLDLGYKEVQGIYHYEDNHYVASHLYDRTLMEHGEQFSISIADAHIQMIINSDLRKAVSTGGFIYVDSCFCINDEKYVSIDKNGVGHLTKYARNNMHECCLVFKINRRKNDAYGLATYTECVLYRIGLTEFLSSSTYEELPKNANVIDRAKRLKVQKDLYATLKTEVPREFSDALSFYMDELKLSNEEVANRAGVSSKTISRLRNPKPNSRKRPSFELVFPVLLALHIPPDLSMDLMEMSKCGGFGNDLHDQVLKTMLTVNWRKSLAEINEELRALDIPTFKEFN